MRRAVVAVGLVLLCGLLVAIRGLGFERVVDRATGEVVLALDDAQYHARRAAYTAENFPSVLWFDPYLNHPEGAFVPWPPLYDFALGGAGRAIGDFELAAAWAPVLLAAVTALLLFAVGRRLGGAPVGLACVAVLALLPASSRYSGVGNPDHHAAVALVATWLLAAHLAALDSSARWRVGAQVALVGARVAMLLTWHGSILYLVLGEGLAALVAVTVGRRPALRAQAFGCAASAALGFAALGFPHSAYGGAWSVVELSLLQPATLAAAAAVAAFADFWLVRASSPASRLGGVAAVAAIAGCVLAALAWESLGIGWAYASRSEAFIAFNYEAQPLFAGGLRAGLTAATDLYGWFALLLPLLPLAALLGRRPGSDAAPGLFLGGWSAALLVLAVSNARYGSDFAPAAAVTIALLGAFAVRSVSRGRAGVGLVAGAIAWLLIPAAFVQTLEQLQPHAVRSLATLRGARVIVKRPAQGLSRSVYGFVDAVREATPETAGWADPAERPEYGIVTPPTLGFIVNARARRATPAGNFGPYVGREGIEATNRFYLARNERAALAAVRDLAVRYAITSDEGTAPGRLWHRLHHGDGSATARQAALGHFRLVTESTQRGVPLGALRGAAPDFVEVPYKLFEIVAGAQLEVQGLPGEEIAAAIEVETPSGRRFEYRTRAVVGADGLGRLRVPYATERGATPARPIGLYQVTRGGELWNVSVTEDQVRSGASRRVAGVTKEQPQIASPLARPGDSGTFPAR